MPNGPEAREADTDRQDSPSGPGPLIAIGGAEDKLGRRTVLETFVSLSGGEDAKIAVIPTASSLGPEVVEVYDALFRKLGAADVVAARPESREEAEDPDVVGLLDDVTGIFMTGGNQLKLSGIVNGTAFGDAIAAARARGAVVGGTSAGASIQSSHMVAFGPGGSTPKQRMTQLAAGLGLIRDVVAARPESREEAEDPALVATLDDVTGIFMTGGNQLKLSAIVNGTAFGDAIKAAHRRGVVVGGTSAGASIQSSHMVAFGTGGSTPKQRMTQLAAGLGLIRDVVIDQHFGQRNRYGRLLMLVAQSPGLLGIGVDEDTGAVITEEDGAEVMRVVGRGVVTVFDGRNVVSNAHEARRTAPLLASGVVLHVLPAGSVFNLTEKTLVRQAPVVDPGEAEELAVAGRDLKRLARDIAAGDVSPSVLKRRRARQTSEGDRP